MRSDRPFVPRPDLRGARAAEWDEQGIFPREIFTKAADLGSVPGALIGASVGGLVFVYLSPLMGQIVLCVSTLNTSSDRITETAMTMLIESK